MINQIHRLLFRPEKGWDPVPPEHVEQYGRFAWENLLDENTIRSIEALLGPIAGKKALDLGGGPGQYSVAFAKRGADVTWHDISAGYRAFANQRAGDAGMSISWSLGYLEDAGRLGRERFDLVFCRSCWYYSAGDRPFADLIYSLVKPGGCVFINTPIRQRTPQSATRRIQHFLYENLGFKVGHPMPPPGRIVRLFRRFATEGLTTRKIEEKDEEEILFRKPLGATPVQGALR